VTQAAIDAVVAAHPPHGEGFARLFELFHAALEGTGPLPVTLAEARHSLEIVTAVYHSARTGARVPLPLSAAHPAWGGWLP
jgi:predicted dehydrogenase